MRAIHHEESKEKKKQNVVVFSNSSPLYQTSVSAVKAMNLEKNTQVHQHTALGLPDCI